MAQDDDEAEEIEFNFDKYKKMYQENAELIESDLNDEDEDDDDYEDSQNEVAGKKKSPDVTDKEFNLSRSQLPISSKPAANNNRSNLSSNNAAI